MAAYCEVVDLLTGDMPVKVERASQFIQAGADEINQRLGSLFVLPPGDNASDVAVLTLKRANVLLATARYIMAQAVGSEDLSTHAYGTYLLREGQAILDGIASGDIPLPGVDRPTNYATSGNAPSVVYEDSVSAVDTFYGFVMRGEYANQYRPGV